MTNKPKPLMTTVKDAIRSVLGKVEFGTCYNDAQGPRKDGVIKRRLNISVKCPVKKRVKLMRAIKKATSGYQAEGIAYTDIEQIHYYSSTIYVWLKQYPAKCPTCGKVWEK